MMRALLALLLSLLAAPAIAQVGTGNGYPLGATPIEATVTGTTTSVTATLAASATQRTWICGFNISSDATAGTSTNATVTGAATTPLNFVQPTGALTSPAAPLAVNFSPCIPSSAVNTAIAVVSGAPGSGGIISVTAWGFNF